MISLTLNAASLVPSVVPRVCFGLLWLNRVSKKLPVKVDVAICSYVITLPGQSLNVTVILNNKMQWIFVHRWMFIKLRQSATCQFHKWLFSKFSYLIKT